MFFYSVFGLFQGVALFLLIAVFLFLGIIGFLLQFSLSRARAPLPFRSLPLALCLLILLLLFSYSVGWLSLPLRAYNTLVKSGLMRIWGVCSEGFLCGCLLGWLTRFFDRNRKKK